MQNNCYGAYTRVHKNALNVEEEHTALEHRPQGIIIISSFCCYSAIHSSCCCSINIQ